MLIARTARLLLRPFEAGDLAALAPILADPEVMRHSVRGPADLQTTRRFIGWCQQTWQQQGLSPWALVERQSGQLIGYCGLGPDRVEGREELNLGYRLARSHWGQGLASEAVQASLAQGFSLPWPGSVVAIIAPEHRASQRVVEKAGFSGFAAAQFHGQPVRLYRLGRAQWLAGAAALSQVAGRS